MGKGLAKAGFRVMLTYFEIKKAFRYYIKHIDSILPCVCSVIDHRRRQNVVRSRTSVTHSATSRVPLFCSYHILTPPSVNLSFSMFTSSALSLPVHLQRAVSTIKDARKKQ